MHLARHDAEAAPFDTARLDALLEDQGIDGLGRLRARKTRAELLRIREVSERVVASILGRV